MMNHESTGAVAETARRDSPVAASPSADLITAATTEFVVASALQPSAMHTAHH